MSNIEVVGLGALNIDRIYQVERILDDGEAVVGEAVSFPGGSAANTIYGLAKLGVDTGFTGVVGDDAEGAEVRTRAEKLGFVLPPKDGVHLKNRFRRALLGDEANL